MQIRNAGFFQENTYTSSFYSLLQSVVSNNTNVLYMYFVFYMELHVYIRRGSNLLLYRVAQTKQQFVSFGVLYVPSNMYIAFVSKQCYSIQIHQYQCMYFVIKWNAVFQYYLDLKSNEVEKLPTSSFDCDISKKSIWVLNEIQFQNQHYILTLLYFSPKFEMFKNSYLLER